MLFSEIYSRSIAPIHIAAENGNFDVLKILISHPDIDVNSTTILLL